MKITIEIDENLVGNDSKADFKLDLHDIINSCLKEEERDE